MRGIENTPARPLKDDCRVTHVSGGTVGRMLRAARKFARGHPDWRASGSLEQVYGQVVQRVVLADRADRGGARAGRGCCL